VKLQVQETVDKLGFFLLESFFVAQERLLDYSEILKKGKIIGLDMDGVLAQSREPVIAQINLDFGTRYTIADARIWGSVMEMLENQGFTEEEALDYSNWVWRDPEIIFSSSPIRGSLEFTLELSRLKIPFYVITSRVPELRASTFAWFEKWMPWIGEDQICMQIREEMDRGIFKAWMVKVLNVGLLIDDSVEHSKTVLDYTDAKVVLLSDVSTLDHRLKEGLIRIPGEYGLRPTMEPVYELLFGHPTYVAQY
jgi:5'(3')-deoxyribonucleotidase